MGGQGGIARFLGSCRMLVGYVDNGKAIWRRHNGMDRRKWKRKACFAGQREAAKYFGAASAVAGNLWSKMPKEMRRISDDGAFNRLVGRCRDLVEEDGQVWNVDELAGLDLAVDSSGPLAIVGSVESGFRLTGVRELMLGIDAAVGPGAGQRSEKYIVANRFNDYKTVKTSVDWKQLGDCRDWRGKHKEGGKRPVTYEFRYGTIKTKRREYGHSWWEPVRAPLRPGLPYTRWTGPQRRIKVWLHASELGSTLWDANRKRYELDVYAMLRGNCLETDWFVGSRFPDPDKGVHGWANEYAIEGKLELPPYDPRGTGIFVIFAAVEVSEKRGRHWVRLPWCSRMLVHSVVDNWDTPAPEGYQEPDWVRERGSLRAVAARRVAGMDFERAWAAWLDWAGWDTWLGGMGVFRPDRELVLLIEENGALSVGDDAVMGVLCRAGP